MKYKIGDRVRIIMPEHPENWSWLEKKVGVVGTIHNIYPDDGNSITYEVIIKKREDGKTLQSGRKITKLHFFEEELELFIKPGEQLLFSFMSDSKEV